MTSASWTPCAPEHTTPSIVSWSCVSSVACVVSRVTGLYGIGFECSMIGREFPVLVEGPSEETELLWECRMQSQAPEIDGVCYINDLGEGTAAPGQIRRYRVTEAHDYDLVGQLVDDGAAANAPAIQVNPFQILTGNRPEASHTQRP